MKIIDKKSAKAAVPFSLIAKGAVFYSVNRQDRIPFMKGADYKGNEFAINLSDGTVSGGSDCSGIILHTAELSFGD